MDDLLLFIVIISIFFLIMFMINNKFLDKEVIRVKSTVDGQVYIVRDLPNSQEASNKLVEIISQLNKYLIIVSVDYYGRQLKI